MSTGKGHGGRGYMEKGEHEEGVHSVAGAWGKAHRAGRRMGSCCWCHHYCPVLHAPGRDRARIAAKVKWVVGGESREIEHGQEGDKRQKEEGMGWGRGQGATAFPAAVVEGDEFKRTLQ